MKTIAVGVALSLSFFAGAYLFGGIYIRGEKPHHILALDATSGVAICAVGTNQTDDRVVRTIKNPLLTNGTWFVYQKDGRELHISDPTVPDSSNQVLP